MRRKLFGFSNDKLMFYQSWIVRGSPLKNHLLIATSWGSPVELDVFRALPESAEKLRLVLIMQ